jgi:probable F420-dependent oxidoreductase
MAVRIGVQLQPQHAPLAALRQAAAEAEQLGVDTIYTWDHFYPLSGEPDGMHWEGSIALAAIATVTERVRLGGLVFCNSYRNPQLLADIHRTLDHLSGGRMIFGIGAGWFERDYAEYGYEFGTAPERLRALRRDLPLIKSRLTKLSPPPLGPLPLMIGGGGEQVTLRLVAEHAQIWHSFGDLDTYLHKSAVLAEHCAKLGRDPATIERVWGTDTSDAEALAGLADAGVGELTVGITGAPDGYDLEPLRALLRWRDRYNEAH